MQHWNRRQVLQASAAAVSGALWAQTASLGAEDAPEYRDAVFVNGPPPLPKTDSFTIAVLPDTQHYCEQYPETYLAQTRWIVEQREQRNIACVLHLGDITNGNSPQQWAVAQEAMRQLDGRVPYFMAPGNHDYGEGGYCQDRSTQFNEYFPLAAHRDRPTFGGVYDREPARFENSYHLFSAGGRDFVVLCLEFGPRADVVRWAREVAAEHIDRSAILVTHAYMYCDEKRHHWKKYRSRQSWNPHEYGVATSSGGDVCDGEELWQRLVAPTGNFILTMNGHVLNDGLARLTSRAPDGREIPQVLVNSR